MTNRNPKDNRNTAASAPDPQEMIRLSKLMSERGLCSRREADELIAQGQVFVDGHQVNELGFKVLRTARIDLGAKAKAQQKSLLTVLLNKPIGFVSAQPEAGYRPAIQLLTLDNYSGSDVPPAIPQQLKDMAVCGRLDIDSQGLLVFSQDGRIAKKLIGENSEVEKEYLVRVSGPKGEVGQSYLPKDQLKLLQFGLELDGQKLKPARVEWVNEDQLRFILKEGKKRQVRRMCQLVGLTVLGLKRTRVGKVKLGDLPEGRWRFLLPSESF